MENQNIFKWKHYQPGIILLTVRWYLRNNLSFRDITKTMKEDYQLLAQRACTWFIIIALYIR
ncbi:hypothetical protein CN285_21980 [Bacillus cereus]|nr:hypothetical protein CN285_21980 [Bacillus cereus]PGM60808.1 hypothetical protein CN947_15655 [Bacillus cereus]